MLKSLVICLVAFSASSNIQAVPTNDLLKNLPALKPQIPPLAKENRQLLFKRIIADFDNKYKKHLAKNEHKSLSKDFGIYYLRQELQSLIDMWRATGQTKYLEQAKQRALKAILDAESNPKLLLWHNKPRGNWPCFFSKTAEKATGGHTQIQDFQGSAGLMMVASELHTANISGWKQIADFVENRIIEKWLFYEPNHKASLYTSEQSNLNLLIVLNEARDKREHFATICLNLDSMGYKKYPYKQWAAFLIDVYLRHRTNIKEKSPHTRILGKHTPGDWGLIKKQDTQGFLWYWTINNKLVLQDTSHANRTVWLACAAYSDGLLNCDILTGFVRTFKNQIWSTKGAFYFNNYIDGTNTSVGGIGPNRAGNIWFGWHRLAAYDEEIKNLFVSLAYDVTNNGSNMPISQNKSNPNANLCFLAWGARLIAEESQSLQLFP